MLDRVNQSSAMMMRTIRILAGLFALPLRELARHKIRRLRQTNVDGREELLRTRMARRGSSQNACRVSVVELCPELDEICRPMRRGGEDISLARIDRNGFLCPRFEHLWAVPNVHAHAFLPRRRFELTVVDHDGWIGIRKSFGGNKAAFVNELEASLDLVEAGCHVPPVLAVDFENRAITFAYIDGLALREALVQAGAPARDRDRTPGTTRLANRRLHREQRKAGRRLVKKVIDRETINRIGDELLAVHRAGYALDDVKYGNIIIEAKTKTPYFVDCERALPLRLLSRASATYLRDRDAEEMNKILGTNLLTAKALRRIQMPADDNLYSPIYAGYGIWWGAVWNPDLGIWRWRRTLANDLPIPRGGRILDLGTNNGFNALQMLRAGAHEVIGVEIDPAAIKQGLFVKRVFEWADNTNYRFSYVRGSHANVASMKLGRFDLVTALCTLYYLSGAEMAKTVSDLAKLTDTLVLQCNDDRSIPRRYPETFIKASLAFNVELVRNNGFPNVTTVEHRGSKRPLVIARTS